MNNKTIKPPPTISKGGYAYLILSSFCLLVLNIITSDKINLPIVVERILAYSVPIIIIIASIVLLVVAIGLYGKNVLISSMRMMMLCKLIANSVIVVLYVLGFMVLFGGLWLMSWVTPFFAFELDYNVSNDGENSWLFTGIMGHIGKFTLWGPVFIILAAILIFTFSFPIMLNLNTLRKYKIISIPAQIIYTLLLFVPVLDWLVCVILLFSKTRKYLGGYSKYVET